MGHCPENVTPVTKLNDWLEERQLMHNNLRQHLVWAKQVMKNQDDKNRTHREFQVGDAVFLELQPYIQTSVAQRANHKLVFKYSGLTILARINVSYKLQLPEGSSIYPVFHVSLLRKVLVLGTNIFGSFTCNRKKNLQVPEKILEKRWCLGAHKQR